MQNGIAYVQPSLWSSLGSIENYGRTDNSGKLETIFHSAGDYGQAIVTARVGTISTAVTITINQTAPVIAGISISAEDTILVTAPGQLDSTIITVTVVDTGGNGVSGVRPELWTETSVGVLRALGESDTTDFSGRITTVFCMNQNFGINTVHTRLGEFSDQIQLSVQQVNITQISVQVSPSVLNVPTGGSGSSTVDVWVRDNLGNGVALVHPEIESSIGVIQNYSVTDNSGKVSTTFFSAGDFGDARIIARVGAISDTATITVNETATLTGTIELATDLNVIYASGGITFANVAALLKDANLQVMAGDTIMFTSTAGTIMTNRITDSLGIAHSIFTDNGVATVPDSAMIIGRYEPFGISDTIYITILEEQPINHITLTVNPENMVAGIDSASCLATVFQENGEFAPAGTTVSFSSDSGGSFSPSNITTLNTNGQGSVYFRAPSAKGITHITATCSGVISNSVECHINAGPVGHVYVAVDPPVLQVNSQQTALVTISVTDSLGNLVGGNVYVALTASLGSIASGVSTVNGVAVTTFQPGTQAGVAIVTAYSGIYGDSTSVSIISGGPSSITLTTDNAFITVAGVGGDEQAQLTANVTDASGNGVPDGVVVHFLIVNAASLGGININNHGTSDSAMTSNGDARVTLNSGTVSGPVDIRASTYTNEGILIFAENSAINVGSGPPNHIIVGHNNEGNDGGSGNWWIDVHASISDIYDNPVQDGIAVFFIVQPDTANIMVDSVVTGNSIPGGNPVAGNAYTILSYNGAATFEVVTVTAQCNVPGGGQVNGFEIFPLPLQQCEVTLYCVPIAWHFGYMGDPCRSHCRATVRDGHGQPINNAMVMFSATRGQFFTSETGGQQVNERLTGQPPDPDGEASLWLRCLMQWGFPDQTTPEYVVNVNAMVYGYQACVTDAVQVLFQR
jgi:hypothetical protein